MSKPRWRYTRSLTWSPISPEVCFRVQWYGIVQYLDWFEASFYNVILKYTCNIVLTRFLPSCHKWADQEVHTETNSCSRSGATILGWSQNLRLSEERFHQSRRPRCATWARATCSKYTSATTCLCFFGWQSSQVWHTYRCVKRWILFGATLGLLYPRTLPNSIHSLRPGLFQTNGDTLTDEYYGLHA